jgi:hypothetical protein
LLHMLHFQYSSNSFLPALLACYYDLSSLLDLLHNPPPVNA